MEKTWDVIRERHKKIVSSRLYQFLTSEPTGRKILAHLWNHDISFRKAAEAITEAFEFGIEPVLPEYRGLKGED